MPLVSASTPGVAAQGFWHPTLDALPDSLAILDPAGEIVAVNRSWRAFAQANGDASGCVAGNYLAVCDRAAATDPVASDVAAALREIAAGSRTEFACVYPCHSPTQERWFSMQVALLPDASERHVVVTHHDFTQQYLAQQLTQAMERQLRGARDFRDAVLQTMPDGLFVLDAGGRVALVNGAAEKLLGWPRGELLGAAAHEQIQVLGADGTLRGFESSLDSTATQAEGSVRIEDDDFRCRDGTLLPVTYSVAAFTSEAGDRGSVVVFSDVSERRAREMEVQRELATPTWVSRIRAALDEDRLVLYAQPIVEVGSGRVVQHELLLRMLGTDGEIIAPGAFLPTAEKHGMIRAIDRRVFKMALRHAAAGHPVEVNLSADSIGDPTLFGFVRDELEAHGVDPRLVVFELTETALIHDEEAALAFTEAVVALGCSVALDDFGTGYGSFHYLKQLPVSLLKIDREFVRDLDGEQGAASRHVVTAIVSLARSMGKKIVAEGVETEAALAVIRELGVDRAQGYLFSRPMPADEVFARRCRS